MSISVLPATPNDASETVDLGMRAFWNDPLSRLSWNPDTATSEQIVQFKQWRRAMSTTRMSGSGKHYFKAVDNTTGAIVGFVGTYAPEGFDIEATWQSPTPAPEFVNQDAMGEFRERQIAAKAKWLGERRDVWYVQSMAVSPDHWGRGIGKKLLKRALQEVDKAGQDMYLEATPAATGLYKNCGFEVLEEMHLLGGELTMTAMIRRYNPGA